MCTHSSAAQVGALQIREQEVEKSGYWPLRLRTDLPALAASLAARLSYSDLPGSWAVPRAPGWVFNAMPLDNMRSLLQ